MCRSWLQETHDGKSLNSLTGSEKQRMIGNGDKPPPTST
eukprot:CAMPEP_0168586284 /NCGR_PEP_ID=MMETSP0420-20121227/4189_1 /TAXON_ID=498008 /ORGANISM="Pessonella sp." /LENGTH=38 /DNA_ID= /DNA_START= /DNA_END= /DNA_ORIENTATION=